MSPNPQQQQVSLRFDIIRILEQEKFHFWYIPKRQDWEVVIPIKGDALKGVDNPVLEAIYYEKAFEVVRKETMDLITKTRQYRKNLKKRSRFRPITTSTSRCTKRKST